MLCRLCGLAYATTTDMLCDPCRLFPIQPQPEISWTCPMCGSHIRYGASAKIAKPTALCEPNDVALP